MTDPPAITIEWQAPADCPDAASVRKATERLLGKRLENVQGAAVRASGQVTLNAAGKWELQAQLEVAERVEQDTLVANHCGALRDAMALKVALAADPLAVVEAVQPPPPAAPSAPPQPPAPAATRTSFRVGLRFVGQLGSGPLPGATPGAGVYASLQGSHFRIELGGEAFWAGVARYDSLPNVGADLQLFSATLRGCATPGAGSWLFPICAGPALGAMRARGFGVELTSVASELWGGVVLGPAVQWRMTRRLSLWLEGALMLTLLRPEFHVRNLGTLYTPAVAGARGALGFEANF